MFRVVEESTPELLKISSQIRDNALIYAIMALFFGRLIYLQVSMSGPDAYKSLIKDFASGYVLLYLSPALITVLSSIPESLFNVLAYEPLFVDISDAPGLTESDVSVFSSFELVTKNLVHYLWIMIFWAVYIIWVIFYSVAIALSSLFIFIGTFGGKKGSLSLYLSMLGVLMLFPIVWVIFDQVIAFVLPQNEVSRALAICALYIAKIYVMWKAFMGLSNSRATQVAKTVGRDSVRAGKSALGFIGRSGFATKGMETARVVGQLASARIRRTKDKFEPLTPTGDHKGKTGEALFRDMFDSDSPPLPLTPAEKFMKSKEMTTSKTSLSRKVEFSAKKMRKDSIVQSAKSFDERQVEKYSNPVKAYGFSRGGEALTSKVPQEIIDSAHNLTGYEKVFRSDSTVYNPDGNFVYNKEKFKGKGDQHKAYKYVKQISDFNQSLKEKYKIGEENGSEV